mgnify:CR=1 FL=1
MWGLHCVENWMIMTSLIWNTISRIFREVVLQHMQMFPLKNESKREQYVGICEDAKVGISLIFTMQNGVEYMKERQLGMDDRSSQTVSLFPVLLCPGESCCL